MAIASTAQSKGASLWLNRNFVLFWLSRVISGLGDGLHLVAIGLWIYKGTHSVLPLSTFMVAKTITPVVISPLAGLITDRLGSRKLLIWTNLVRAPLVGLIAYLTLLGPSTMGILLVTTVLISIAGALSFPASQAAMTLLVDQEHIARASAFQRSTEMIVQFFGPMFGGALVAAMAPAAALTGDAISFLVAAFLLMGAAFAVPKRSNTDTQTATGYWQEFLEGLRYMRVNVGVAALVGLMGALTVFGIAQGVVMTAHSLSVWKLSDLSYGVMQSGFPLGLTLGSLVVMLKPKWKHPGIAICVTLIISGTLGLLIPFAPGLVYAYPVMVVAGSMTMLAGVLSYVMFLKLVPADMQGRFFGFYGAVNGMVMPLGSLVGGISDKVGTVPALVGIALCWILSAVLPLLVRGYREMA